jgi:hypothetical protein
MVYLSIPYGNEHPELLHLVQDELQTGVISTGEPTPILSVVIDAPVVAHLNVIGVELKLTPLQSR